MKNSDKSPLFIKPRTPPQINQTHVNQVEILNLDDDQKEKKLKGTKRITLNARGTKFEVYINSFEKIGKSRLGKLKAAFENNKRDQLDDLCDEFDQKSNEFFFDRDQNVLSMIINYLRTNKMHYIEGVCPYLIAEEFEYWGIDEYLFDECCNDKYWGIKNSLEDKIAKKNEIIEAYLHSDNFGKWFFPDIRAKVWEILEHPEKSWVATVIFFVIKYFIKYSII